MAQSIISSSRKCHKIFHGKRILRTQDAWYTPQSYPLALLHPGASKEYFKGRMYKGHGKGTGRRGPGSGRVYSQETHCNRSTLFALEKILLEIPLAQRWTRFISKANLPLCSQQPILLINWVTNTSFQVFISNHYFSTMP